MKKQLQITLTIETDDNPDEKVSVQFKPHLISKDMVQDMRTICSWPGMAGASVGDEITQLLAPYIMWNLLDTDELLKERRGISLWDVSYCPSTELKNTIREYVEEYVIKWVDDNTNNSNLL